MPKTFLYNGVELPALPEWDKTVYPYAFIEKTLFMYYLRVLTNPLAPDGDSFRFTQPGLVTAVKSDMSGWDEWSEVTENTRTPLWTNTDILNSDGTLHLAASDPIPVTVPNPFCLRSWLTGFALGLAGKSLPYSKVIREPVAYLYNGVRLPKLPEWDKTVYPYVYIDCNTGGDGRYRAWFLSEKMHSGAFGIKTYPEGTICMFFRLVDGVWEFEETDSEGGWPSIDVPLDPIWTNYDYLDYNPYSDEPDGTVLLAASTPVPVYE